MAIIKFLGTAGARYVVARQLRASGGVYIEAEGTRLVLDPGPGTLVYMAREKLRVEKLSGIIVTHVHLDHSADLNILVDAITEGGLKKRGTVFIPREGLYGENAVLLPYLRPYLQRIEILGAQKEFRLGEIAFRTSVRHHHPVETYGIVMEVSGKRVGFVVDTLYFKGLLESYQGCDLLIFNVVRFKPHPSPQVQHLSVANVKEMVEILRPERAVLTHFGMTMIRANPKQVAQKLTKETGIPVIAAYDGFEIEL
ncbi:MBL fold metallo-hydrolase [Thermosulfurimonas dismutans]|uniref:Metal-dependent hydrolase of the beta-lactamase superfamily n=1 Tax=Thermosulfurimonas dismutans TaxID=999894 RepID=A0A179D221_9BACT|nr:MBL fold metallo-hydrolase [Thermosulfurimonas dismutans]OAQ20106.1 Metal-dependent hydrolase of the beta-lactamase superfamily [Thermosulfurimonas dismutans]